MSVLLGLDPGLPAYGWAVVRDGSRPQVIASGTWHLDITDPPAVRLAGVVDGLRRLIYEHNPTVRGCEAWIFQGFSARNGIHMAQLVGASVAVCGPDCLLPTPQQWRGALGLPRTAKEKAILDAVRRLTDGWRPENIHEACAVGIALWSGAHALEGTRL